MNPLHEAMVHLRAEGRRGTAPRGGRRACEMLAPTLPPPWTSSAYTRELRTQISLSTRTSSRLYKKKYGMSGLLIQVRAAGEQPDLVFFCAQMGDDKDRAWRTATLSASLLERLRVYPPIVTRMAQAAEGATVDGRTLAPRGVKPPLPTWATSTDLVTHGGSWLWRASRPTSRATSASPSPRRWCQASRPRRSSWASRTRWTTRTC